MCVRCGREINSEKTAFVAVLTTQKSNVVARLEFASNVEVPAVVLHVNGDRECGKELANYRRELFSRLQLRETVDVSWLDSI